MKFILHLAAYPRFKTRSLSTFLAYLLNGQPLIMFAMNPTKVPGILGTPLSLVTYLTQEFTTSGEFVLESTK